MSIFYRGISPINSVLAAQHSSFSDPPVRRLNAQAFARHADLQAEREQRNTNAIGWWRTHVTGVEAP